MFRTRTTSISLKKEDIFEELIEIFDSKELDIQNSEFDIKPFFRRFSKYDPKKIINDCQVLEVNIQKFVKRNSDWINKSYKVDFSSMDKSAWI